MRTSRRVAPSGAAPGRDRARGGAATGSPPTSGGGPCTPRYLERALFCAGVLVLLENALLLHWGWKLLEGCHSPWQLAPADHETAAPSLRGGVASQAAALGGTVGAAAPKQHARGGAKKRRRRARAAGPSRTRAAAGAVPAAPATPAPPPQIAVGDGSGNALAAGGGGTAQGGGAAATAGKVKTASATQLRADSSLLSVPRESLRLLGSQVPRSVRFCVGFGSVKRKKDYVLDTVGTMLGLHGDTSIVSQEERDMVVVVAHLAEWDMDWVKQISGRLFEDYRALIDAGHFHVVHAPEELYPNLDVCPPFCAYKDEPKRVKWRSKQNIDYAFLMYYAAPLAPYYLQIEDDLGFAGNWIRKMDTHVQTSYGPGFQTKEHVPWRLMDFSQLGFIGKLFQGDEVTRMAQFLLLFYDQMPCDLLLEVWMRSMNQGRRIEYWKKAPSLFQHVGVFRTLGGYQPLQERKFGKLLFDNPAGSTAWNMSIVPTYEGQFVYFPGGEPAHRKDKCDGSKSPAHKGGKSKRCWFWANKVRAYDHFTIVFDAGPGVPLKAVFAEFGHPKHPKDMLDNGAIQVAGPGSYGGDCGPFFQLAEIQRQDMVYWEEGVSTPAALPVPLAKCLRIESLQDQEGWLAIMQIQVRTT